MAKSRKEKPLHEQISPRHMAFADLYLRHFNAGRAYKEIYNPASDKSAWSNGARLLKHEKVRAYIEHRLSERAMGLDEILARLGDMARGDLGDFIDDDGELSLARARELGLTHLIKRVKQKTLVIDEREVEELWVELHDPQQAMDKILKVIGAYAPDKLSLTDPAGQPVHEQFAEALAKVYGSKDGQDDD